MVLMNNLLIILVCLFTLASVSTALPPPPLVLPNCSEKCGNVIIPYPFGMKEGCFRNPDYNITCENGITIFNSYAKSSDYFNRQVREISLSEADLVVEGENYAFECFDDNGETIKRQRYSYYLGQYTPFTISATRNKLIAIGCDTFAYLDSNYFGAINFTSGCISLCGSVRSVGNGSCDGTGCCQASIPSRVKGFYLNLDSKYNHTRDNNANPCGFAFVGDPSGFTFDKSDLSALSYKRSKIPMVLDWAIGNQTCEEALQNKTSYACGPNSYCFNSTNVAGYLCKCKDGFEGNPYLPKIGCRGASAGFLVLPIFILFSFWAYKGIRRKINFENNGGILMRQQINLNHGDKKGFKLFTIKELQKATNNFREKIREGEFDEVFRGELPSGKGEVAIRRPKKMYKGHIIRFIDEVDILSQTNQDNVVKLAGCCLDFKDPILVYECFSRRTLFDYIHGKNHAKPLSWEDRIRIATETAKGLDYLHSFHHSLSIFHMNVKSSTILIDDEKKAKVSDFGASGFFPVGLDETKKKASNSGYLDPEYCDTGCELNDKSDVYSFGVVLAELLTGEKRIISSKEKLEMYFISPVKDGRLFDKIRIQNDGKEEQFRKIVVLAMNCLQDKREDRPTMKQVLKELDSFKKLSFFEKPSFQHNQKTEHHRGEPSTSSNIDAGFEIDDGC
ncbi:wall-associated receptor kinase 3-like isoform X2 [Macadamia integrifolia]|uniref:wall-associated receptor kinase 3-like isoform X2 n=1 Tax=Macadamia integrifolia TaxID=60698 RepID=UPI001C4E8C07|nr:wall-associated receptor kinase 3-like isoform X2 [Macadamia integrifolia]